MSHYRWQKVSTSANPVLSDSKVLLKFAFCMLKNNTQDDFQLKISTPGILAAVRRSGEEVIKIQIWCDLFCKIPLRGWWAGKNWFFLLTTFLVPAIFWPFFPIWWIKKWPEPKKLLKEKINFIMSVNHAKEFYKINHTRFVIL